MKLHRGRSIKKGRGRSIKKSGGSNTENNEFPHEQVEFLIRSNPKATEYMKETKNTYIKISDMKEGNLKDFFKILNIKKFNNYGKGQYPVETNNNILIIFNDDEKIDFPLDVNWQQPSNFVEK